MSEAQALRTRDEMVAGGKDPQQYDPKNPLVKEVTGKQPIHWTQNGSSGPCSSGPDHGQDREGEGESISLAGVNYPESIGWDKDPAPLQDSSVPWHAP